jgi:hypothetical protein
MRTLAEARASIVRAATDRTVLRISDAELEAVKEQFNRRLMQVKKQALMSSAAKVITRASFREPALPNHRPIRVRVP